MKEIPGFPGYLITSGGGLWSFREAIPKRIKPRWHKGYLCVRIKTAPGRANARTLPLHQLILLAWVGPRPSEEHVGRHRDGCVANNVADNLRWGTPHDNIHDAISHGTHVSVRRGELHPRAKLSDKTVREVKVLAREGTLDAAAIAAANGVTASYVRAIARGAPRHRGGMGV